MQKRFAYYSVSVDVLCIIIFKCCCPAPEGGEVDPDSGSVTSKDHTVVNETTITPPTGSNTVTTDKDGNTPVGPGSTAGKGEVTVTINKGGAVVDKDGNVNFLDGGRSAQAVKMGLCGGCVHSFADPVDAIYGCVILRGNNMFALNKSSLTIIIEIRYLRNYYRKSLL